MRIECVQEVLIQVYSGIGSSNRLLDKTGNRVDIYVHSFVRVKIVTN